MSVTPLYSSGGPSNMAAVGFIFPKIDAQSSPIFEISGPKATRSPRAPPVFPSDRYHLDDSTFSWFYLFIFLSELKTAPIINKIVAAGPRSLEIFWSAPATDSYTGDLSTYQVCSQASHVNGGAENCSMVTVGGGLVRAEVNNLRPNREYNVKMRGGVALGYGPFSNTMSKTTPEAGMGGF